MKRTLLIFSTLWPCAQRAVSQMPPTCTLLDAGFLTTSWGGVTETADGGAAFTGGYDPINAGHSDVVLTKLDGSVALQWMKTYSTGSAPSEWGRDILATSDGGIAVAGHLEAGQVFIMKLDANGVPQWTKTYDAPGPLGHQMASGFIQLPDGGFALTSTCQFLSYDAWFMLRTEANGDVLWSDELDYTGGYPMDVAALPNGDLIFIGDEGGLGTPSVILRKDGLTGTTEWMHWYTAGSDHIIEMRGVVTSDDSTIVVAGITGDATYLDAFALALSPDGTPLWATHIGTDEFEFAENIARAPNGDYLLAGARLQDTTFSPPLGRFVVRLDPTGQLLWSKNVSHPDAINNWPVRCAAASDGGVLITGYAGTMTNYPQSFIKLDASGNSCPYCPSESVGTQDTLAVTLAQEQGSAFAGPWATAADLTFTVVDITASVSSAMCGITGLQEQMIPAQVTIAPNPFVRSASISFNGVSSHRHARLEILDLSGRSVLKQRLEAETTVIERGALAAGQYIYQVSDDSGTLARGVFQIAGN